MSCAFCGMPPLDGEPCCTAEYRRDVMRRADRKIREQDAELSALRERLADVELIAREACAGRVLQRFDGRVWTFAFRSNRLQFTECSFPDDGTGLPILTPEARARLRGEVKT